MIKGLTSLSTLFALKVNSAGFSRAGSCVACLDPTAHFGLCPACRDGLPRNRWQCRQCALPLAFASDQMTCGECLKDPPPFIKIIAPWHYRFPVDRMIQRYKDSGQRAFAKPLLYGLSHEVSQALMEQPECQRESQPCPQPDVLVPAPMHPARRRKRGFNQASDIAEHLSRELGIPWTSQLVTRPRQTQSQRGLGRESRLANLAGVFRVTGPPPKRVAIIDDVVTTGATVRHLALALKKAGAEDIQVWSLARTPG